MNFSSDIGTAFAGLTLDHQEKFADGEFLWFFSVPLDKFWSSTLK
jgi:hypothetical protein